MDRLIALSVLGALLVITAGINSCNWQDNNAMTQMVKNGADPLSAHCAIKGDGSYSSYCTVIAARDKK